MAFSKPAALRSCFRGARPTAARPQLWRHVARRGYASGGHETAKAGGDAIWAAGAVAVTLPSCWFLLSQDTGLSHGHDDHGSRGEEHGEEHEEEETKEESSEETESEEKSDEGANKGEEIERPDDSEKTESAEKSDDSDSGDEKEVDTPETSDDEGEDKPKTPKDTEDGKNVRKSIPDAKGGSKARLESKKSITAGKPVDEDADGPSDKAALSKEAGNHNTQSGKQEGLTNTDTKHSTDITNDPNKSKKSEGGPDTAKLKGTIDPKRSQPEST